MLDWDDLRHVLAVHRGRSLTQAAEVLGVTRTTVGRRLRNAEEKLGVRLFDRTPEGMVATAAGRELASTAEQVEDAILASEGRVKGLDVALSGTLHVSTTALLFECFPTVFSSFVERHPGVALTVSMSDTNVSLLRREADVVVRMGNAPAEHLVGRKLVRLQFAAYAHRRLAERVGPDAQLSDYPWIQYADWLPEAQWFATWLAANAPTARTALRVSHFEGHYRAMRAGIGAQFLPTCLGDADPDLVHLGAQLTDEARDVWALTLAALGGNRRVRAFLDHAYEAFER